ATPELDVAAFSRGCARRGLHSGPEFRGIRERRTGTTAAGRTAHARIELGQRCRARIRAGELHPALLDAAAQTALVLFDQPTDSTPATVVPVALAEYRILHRPDGFVDRVWAHARQRGPLLADIEIRDDDGRVLAALNGLALAELDTAGADLRDHRREFRMEFTPEPEPVGAPGAECAPRAADTGHPARSERAVFVLVDPGAETGAAPDDPNTQCAHL
ncbi:polyketide synthase dehydratase domain-containing protein, partial [Nocardia puris]|uniref:polyketide synthase dehydratase domain-containing protein n=1 Tax=Nocardia puris TaxID=208602 RepID=UPI001892F1EB